MAEAEHLGGGLDIDGWSFLKNDVQTKINEMTDRSLILRSTFPLVLNSHLKNEKDQKTAYDLIVAIMESKSTIDHPWIGMKQFFPKVVTVKSRILTLDQYFGWDLTIEFSNFS